jgi:hypothetical protein
VLGVECGINWFDQTFDLMQKEPKYRVFKVSISLPFFHYSANSKVYRIDHKWQYLFPVLSHSLMTVLFGFWGGKLFESFKALHINFTGGEDFTQLITEQDYDETTNWVWNNLTRETSEKINRRGVQLLLTCQEAYMENNQDVFSESNAYHLKNELHRKGYFAIRDKDIVDFFEALKEFSQRNIPPSVYR